MIALFVAGAVAATAVGYFWWTGDATTVTAILEEAKDAPHGDPSLSDLQQALGPYQEGTVTVLCALERVLINREWDRKHGLRYELRPGLKDFLRELSEIGAVVTVWSEHNSASASDVMMKLQALGVPISTTPLQLGSDHTFHHEGDPHRREKRIEPFTRPVGTILVIDYDPLTLELNPDSCLLVRKMLPPEVEADPATLTAAEKARASLGEYVSASAPDTTLQEVLAVLRSVHEDTLANGSVNVPYTLGRLRSEADSAGFGADTAGLAAFLAHSTAAKAARERERITTGLGGTLRTLRERSPMLGTSAITEEAAAVRPFRDPAIDFPDSLLSRKVSAANAKFMQRAMGGQQRA